MGYSGVLFGIFMAWYISYQNCDMNETKTNMISNYSVAWTHKTVFTKIIPFSFPFRVHNIQNKILNII